MDDTGWTDPAGWESAWIVTRSYVHDATWVPYSVNDYGYMDEECFLHPGPIRVVKAWVSEQASHHESRWVRANARQWRLLVRLDENAS